MKTKFTPGPWAVRPSWAQCDVDSFEVFPDYDKPDIGQRLEVASVGCATAHEEFDEVIAEAYANALLISAMPDLIEVARMVDTWGNGLRHHTAHESKMVNAARAAIAKATGTP
jgi:hypothetical protein